MSLTLPQKFTEKAIEIGESSMGVTRVTLVLADGRRIDGVFLAWGREIVKIDTRAISTPEELDFAIVDIVDMVSGA